MTYLEKKISEIISKDGCPGCDVEHINSDETAKKIIKFLVVGNEKKKRQPLNMHLQESAVP